jgi:hypothetical protein
LTLDHNDRAVIATFGYLDRRDQSQLKSEDRLAPLPGGSVRRSNCRESTTGTLGRPESLRQAQRFETYRSHYADLGLCASCSALYAYGHQHGFSALIHVQPGQPCTACRPVVETFPDPEVGDLHSYGPESARSCRVSTTGYSESTCALTANESPLSATGDQPQRPITQ